MSVINDLFHSKKFLALLGAEISLFLSGLIGAQPWDLVIKEGVALVMTYIGFQGLSDGLSGGMTSSQPGTPSAKDLSPKS